MKISIAMATYNGASYLQDQLNSFVAQTRQPDELVVSDDASSDDSIGVLESFARVAPFAVRIFRNETNLGYARNFNRALEGTTGDLVFLSDQDDVWFPDKLRRMECFARKNPDACVMMCDATLTDSGLVSAGVTKIGQLRSGGLPMTYFLMGCCAVVRRRYLDVILPIPEGFPAHDAWIVRIADGLSQRAILPEPLQYYRRYGGNQSQVVANKTRAITRGDVFWYRVKLALSSSKNKNRKLVPGLEEERLLRDGVLRAASRLNSNEAEPFVLLQAKLDHNISCLEIRAIIRGASLIGRIPKVIGHWFRGGYKESGGYRSALRDLALF